MSIGISLETSKQCHSEVYLSFFSSFSSKMDLIAIVGLIIIIYTLVYMIFPWFLDCDLNLALHERFGKPISNDD